MHVSRLHQMVHMYRPAASGHWRSRIRDPQAHRPNANRYLRYLMYIHICTCTYSVLDARVSQVVYNRAIGPLAYYIVDNFEGIRLQVTETPEVKS